MSDAGTVLLGVIAVATLVTSVLQVAVLIAAWLLAKLFRLFGLRY